MTEHDRLVGVLSRRDLLSTYLREDHAIRADVEHVVAVANRLERRNPCVSETS